MCWFDMTTSQGCEAVMFYGWQVSQLIHIGRQSVTGPLSQGDLLQSLLVTIVFQRCFNCGHRKHVPKDSRKYATRQINDPRQVACREITSKCNTLQMLLALCWCSCANVLHDHRTTTCTVSVELMNTHAQHCRASRIECKFQGNTSERLQEFIARPYILFYGN